MNATEIVKHLFATKKGLLIVGVLGFVILGIVDEFSRTSEISERGCKNVEDCLANNKFSEARSYLSKMSDFDLRKRNLNRKIISSEVSYYLEANEVPMAKRSLDEYVFESQFSVIARLNGNNLYNEEVDWYNGLVIKILPKINDISEKNALVATQRPSARAVGIESKSDEGGAYDLYRFELIEPHASTP